MASPFGKASSPFADKCGGSNNGLRRFGGQPSQNQKSFGFENVSPFAVPNAESMPKNPCQPSKLFDDGGTLKTKEGSSFLGNASTSPFSFGISSSLERTGNQEKQDSTFQPSSTPFGGEILVSGTSQTMAHGLNILGNASTSSFSTGKASPFAFSSNEHEEKNPFQRLKAVGCEGLASKNSQITKGSLIFGHGSSSPFSFGNSSPFASTSNDQESKNPFKQSTSPFSFGNSSPFASTSNAQESKNTFKQSTSPFGNSSPFASTSNDQESKNPFKQFTSPLSSGNSSPFASITNDQELKNPFKQSTFLIGKSLGSGTSQTMEGSSIQGNASTLSFSFGKSSPFAISSNVHKLEPKNPFQNSTRDGNRSTWSQKETGNSIIGGGSPIIAPFGRPASYQDPLPPFASDPMKHL